MDCRILWTTEALDELNSIVAFIRRDDPLAASRMGNRVLSKIKLLERQPELGKLFGRRTCYSLHKLVVNPYLLFYQYHAEHNKVEILQIWHGARRPPLI